MRTLIENIDQILTFDDDDQEIAGGSILIDDSTIAAVKSQISASDVDRVVDGTGLIALPGLINAHHHLYQGALRALPELDRVVMKDWLANLAARSHRWWDEGAFTPDMVRLVARAVLTESLLSGVTTVADQYMFFPGDGRSEPFIEASIEAREEVGIRLHAGRGSLTLGPRHGGMADPRAVQSVDEVLRHSQELIERFHDPKPNSMVRIVLAPTGIHVDAPELFDETASLSAEFENVGLHTHLYHDVDASVCEALYGITPWQFLEEHGWANDRTWVAHCIDPAAADISHFATAGVGIAHIIACDFRHGWGLAPVRSYLDAGIKVGFATTGSASNDATNLLGDLRLAALAHRPAHADPNRWITARELLRMATRGSAACLGRTDLGALAPGMAADVACWDMNRVDRVGIHEPATGLLLTGISQEASLVIVNGVILVENGFPTSLDQVQVAREARAVIPA